MMDRAEIVVVPVSTVEIVILPYNMIRFGITEVVLFIPGDIPALFIQRKRMEFASVSDIIGSGIAELGIPRCRIAGIHPLIVRLVNG